MARQRTGPGGRGAHRMFEDGVSMELRSGLLGDLPMLVANGSIEAGACDALRAALQRLSEARHNIVFLDLSAVTHVDVAGLSVLVDWVEALRGRGWLGLIEPNADVRRFLDEQGFLAHPNVRCFETKQAARVATGERQST